ncbi:MAG: molecular chaperone TorD family protein [Gammaproteobacteria bacterium]|nr:molecular chaperone TorD family protein [Gammaproteobacteria bacterium]
MSTSEENNKMTAQALALEEFDQHKDQRETVDVFFDAPGNEALDEEQIYRASAYGLIAALLRSAPDQDMLERLTGLSPGVVPEGDELLLAMSTMALSAKLHTTASIDDEYHELFIGLGKGEVVPYGSWYLTGFMMEKPLSDLRDDLARLGYVRNTSVVEPEDHVAALCEVISLMITEGVDLSTQRNFSQSHMTEWMGRFFADLSEAKSAIFYKSVGRFGAAFMAFENEYFSMQT